MIAGGIGKIYWDKNQSIFTCLKLAIGPIEQGVKYV